MINHSNGPVPPASGRYSRDAVSTIALSASVRTGPSGQRVKNLESINVALSHTLQGVISENNSHGGSTLKPLLHDSDRWNPMIKLDRRICVLIIQVAPIPVLRLGFSFFPVGPKVHWQSLDLLINY